MTEIGFTHQQKLTGHLVALFTTLVWGSCFVLTKVMLQAFTPIQIIPLRMGLAYLALWALRPPFSRLSMPPEPPGTVDMPPPAAPAAPGLTDRWDKCS